MSDRFSKVVVVGAVALAALLATGTASAAVAPITLGLDSVLPGGANADGITFGDKRYSNFTFSSTGDVVLDAASVDLRLTETGNTQSLAFLLDLDVAPSGRADVVLGYDVTVLDPSRNIRNVRLSFDGKPAGAGNGRSAASVTETVSTIDGSPVAPGSAGDTAQLTVFNDGDGPLADNDQSTLAVNPATALRFTKDLIVSSRSDGTGAGVSMVENSVTQNGGPTAIPLPPAVWAALPFPAAWATATGLRRLVRRQP
jgi:hypothetical protein